MEVMPYTGATQQEQHSDPEAGSHNIFKCSCRWINENEKKFYSIINL
jgi:hypothetical protein